MLQNVDLGYDNLTFYVLFNKRRKGYLPKRPVRHGEKKLAWVLPLRFAAIYRQLVDAQYAKLEQPDKEDFEAVPLSVRVNPTLMERLNV